MQIALSPRTLSSNRIATAIGPGLAFSALLLLAAIAALAGAPAVACEHQDAQLGVDVSHHSGEIDWQEVKSSGVVFAYLKATEGVDALDPRFAEHWQATQEAGLLRGAYHFYVTEDDPSEQAAFFLETLGELGDTDLIPVVDVEVIGHGTQPGLAKRLATFLEIVEAQLGVKPMLYTSPNFWDAHLDDSFGEYPLWIAEYGAEEPRIPHGWQSWWIWQWAENQVIPGIEKDVDPNCVHPEIEVERLQVAHNRLGPPALRPDHTP